jgi:hypothetical protein
MLGARLWLLMLTRAAVARGMRCARPRAARAPRRHLGGLRSASVDAEAAVDADVAPSKTVYESAFVREFVARGYMAQVRP